ncbi:MAG: hypothetical protein M3081_15240 [Gemmatimonadota bacterium]|nr:hypothetical protein [Gemmatimonadota bacterium]
MSSVHRIALALVAACAATITAPQALSAQGANAAPKIEFSEVPSYDCGGPDKTETFAGRVTGIAPSQVRLVIYAQACNGMLYVQPREDRRIIRPTDQGGFDIQSHLGHVYYVLVTKPTYAAQNQLTDVPEKGGDIIAVFSVSGKKK